MQRPADGPQRVLDRRKAGRFMKRELVGITAAVCLSLVGLTGCTSQDVQASPPASTGSADSAAPEPVLTIEGAGEAYAKLSAASNAAREKWMAAPKPTKSNLAKHKKLAAGAADATVAFSEGLRKHHWPAEVQPIVGALDEHLQERAAGYQRVAAAGTVAEYLAAAREVPVTSSLTSHLREALGLPESAVVKGVSPR
ncbi:hypothetical protein [Actinoplanes sp. GCM10030250]|uniref:hypothetical protein n=1 Tax=Actinoplanes sp. GCM10030250 TaxID=3273376 RepID=UPI00361037F0